MRAVWSLWSLPYRQRRGFSWAHDRHHCLSWILSVMAARPHFDTIALYTDDAGASLLVDRLGLAFDQVSTSLNELNAQDPDWWMQGKLYTYALQQEPFVHLDADVYLFKPLPARLTAGGVLAQNPETVSHPTPWYDVEACEVAIRSRGDGYIPKEWSWYRTFIADQRAACCGIIGGHRVDLIGAYASSALRLLQSPGNRHAFDKIESKKELAVFFEQYLLAAWAGYHKVEIEYLFDSYEQALNGGAAGAGFTHLMANAKCDAAVVSRLERRVARDYPEAYQRCQALSEDEFKPA
jgi:hypothetical protein